MLAPRLVRGVLRPSHELVRGMYVICPGCGCGGHLKHLTSWFEKQDTCPSGCGHRCDVQSFGGVRAHAHATALPAITDLPMFCLPVGSSPGKVGAGRRS